MAVKDGDKVGVEYEGKLENGEVFDSSKHGEHSHPLEFEVGKGQVIKGFDEAVLGMEEGEEKEVTIKPEEGYGPRNEQLVKKFPKDKLPADQEPKEGMMLAVGLPDGRKIPARITKVEEKEIEVDLNHPLAGKVLIFKIKVVKIN
ncbi:MAG: peptidylprolyl isomerase [Nanoarchaeota archaeon]|nr:peptidylprolyl isomerase [Nanoarchaeota archaeon]